MPTESRAVAEVRKRHREFDVAIERLYGAARKEGHTIPCKRGCDACCYEAALAMGSEMAPIFARVRAMNPANQARLRQRVKDYFAKVEAAGLSLTVTTPPEVRAFRNVHIPCPLLDLERHECSIYEDRPIACRVHHIVDSEPSICSDVPEDGVPALHTSAVTNQYFQRILDDALKADALKLSETGAYVIKIGLIATHLLKDWANVGEQGATP